MSNVWFCSDLHFGHKNIQKFRTFVESEEDNRNRILEDWRTLVTKRDAVYVLGDAAFTMESLESFSNLNGIKYLIRGNHDKLDTANYLKYFKQVYGILKYKEFWLSHAPVHPQELRGKVNLHGHVHYETIDDKRYFNCCVENLVKLTGKSMINLQQLRDYLSPRL